MKTILRGVKVRLAITKKNVEDAISLFEQFKPTNISSNELELDALKKEIINIIIEQDYDENKVNELERRIKNNGDNRGLPLLARLFAAWGVYLEASVESKSLLEYEPLSIKAQKLLKRALEMDPNYFHANAELGTFLGKLGRRKSGEEAKELFLDCFNYFQNAERIENTNPEVDINWGFFIGDFADLHEGASAEKYHEEAII